MDILKKFLKIVETEPHWEDILNLIVLMKTKKNPKIKKLIEAAVGQGISRFLKLSPEKALQLADKFL